jgi:hypothetical protein
LVRGHFAEAAGRCSLPLGFSLDMVPILEEELLGYELTAVGDAETCLTLGCKPDGEPVLRKESLTNAPPRALQLVALDGRMIARAPREVPSRYGRRDLRFPDWPSAAKLAWAERKRSSRERRAVRRYSISLATLLERARSGRDEARAMERASISVGCQTKSSLICAAWRRWRTRSWFSPSG